MATVRQPTPAALPDAAALAAAPVKTVPPTPKPVLDQVAIDRRFEALLRHVQANRPTEDVALIRKAWEFCVQHHQGQMRASGEPYVIHPLEVAEVLAEMKLDSTAIAAGLLHDAVEDTPATSEQIETDFGDQVAHIVEGVTKIDKIQFANSEDRQAEYKAAEEAINLRYETEAKAEGADIHALSEARKIVRQACHILVELGDEALAAA